MAYPDFLGDFNDSAASTERLERFNYAVFKFMLLHVFELNFALTLDQIAGRLSFLQFTFARTGLDRPVQLTRFSPNFRLEKSPFRGYISSDRREALLRLTRPLFG